MQKRFLSILLCLTMLSGFVPTGTFAENAGNISSSVSSDASHGGEKTSEDNALPGGEVLSDGEQTPNSENLSDGENSLNEEISLDDEKSSNGEKSSNENLSDGKNPSGKDEAEEIKDKSYGEEKTSLSDDEISLSAVSDSKTETSIAEVTIGENVKYYDDIKEAFDAVQATSNKSTVKLLGDVNIGTGNIVLIKNGDITFDLNGFSLSGSFAAGENFGDGMLSIGASGENPALTFTLDDSSARKSGTIENECSDENTSVIRVCSTKAVLNVAGGTVKRTGNDGISMDAAAVSAVYGNANIYGGKIEGNVYGITAASGLKSVKVYGDADVYGYYAAINSLAYNDSNVELSGGTFSSFANRPVFITQKGTIGSLLAQGYTFTDKNGVKIDSETSSASFFETVSVVENLMPVEYIDENGNDAQCAEYIALMGDPEDGKLDGSSGEAWYVISGDLRATMNWTVTGTVNLILTDSANCVIPVYCIKFEDDSLLRIYGQKNGTGDLAVVSTDKETAALGGPATKSYDPKYGITGDWALGSLEIYGGKIYAESTK